MAFAGWILLTLAMLVSVGIAGFYYVGQRRKHKAGNAQTLASQPVPDKIPYTVSYVPSDIEWSGSSSGTMPLKTLTYKQYECLEDARYGFRIVGVTPTARKAEQPHKTRAHGQKTVASLARHRFLISDAADGYFITDHGLNALEVCDVRY